MKPFRSVLLLMVCLALAGNVPAQARPGSHSGTSSSYKSGFSSQKNKSANHGRPAAPPANRQSGPGAFGKQAGAPASAQQRSRSAMSRDVDRSAAEANALKTLDQRRNAANSQPLPPLNDTLRSPQAPPQPSPVYRAPAYPAPGPGYQQQPSGNGNGLMAGVLGFMLGRAISQSNQPVSYPTTNGGPAAAQQPTNQAAAAPIAAAAASASAPAQAGPGAPSFVASVLRWFAWLAVLGVLAWSAVYTVRKFRRLRAAPHYSFERN